ncbi:MAG: hypothetical protein LBJ00_06620 [Planctomycetaceae bacterium]|nr:hypothetical protein [Planctomycetaceae bacterium]
MLFILTVYNIQAEQNNYDVQYNLGKIFYIEGNYPSAIKWLQKAFESGVTGFDKRVNRIK